MTKALITLAVFYCQLCCIQTIASENNDGYSNVDAPRKTLYSTVSDALWNCTPECIKPLIPSTNTVVNGAILTAVSVGTVLTAITFAQGEQRGKQFDIKLDNGLKTLNTGSTILNQVREMQAKLSPSNTFFCQRTVETRNSYNAYYARACQEGPSTAPYSVCLDDTYPKIYRDFDCSRYWGKDGTGAFFVTFLEVDDGSDNLKNITYKYDSVANDLLRYQDGGKKCLDPECVKGGYAMKSYKWTQLNMQNACPEDNVNPSIPLTSSNDNANTAENSLAVDQILQQRLERKRKEATKMRMQAAVKKAIPKK